MAFLQNNTVVIDNTGNFFVSSLHGAFTGQGSVNKGKSNLSLDNFFTSGASSADRFGFSVAISGNYAIVGARDESLQATFSGRAYIFNVTTGQLLHTLNNPNAYNTPDSDAFGYSVGISGNYAIVGAYQEDDAGGTNSGKAYIYNVTTGTLVHTLNNPNPVDTSGFDLFGHSVAISGNLAIVGAYQEDDAGSNSGKAYIYNVTTGALVYTLNNPNPFGTSDNDAFGISVAISRNLAIVGASSEDDASGNSSGKAYVYNVNTGLLVRTLNNPNPFGTSGFDSFGTSVAITGNYAIVGANGEDDAGGLTSGKAYIFNASSGVLLSTLNNPNAFNTSAGDSFGFSIAVSGNYVVVGTPYEDDSGGTDSGKAYIFNLLTGALIATLDNPLIGGTQVLFGYSVAISGNYVVVGVPSQVVNGYSNAGIAYVFGANGFTTHFDKVMQGLYL